MKKFLLLLVILIAAGYAVYRYYPRAGEFYVNPNLDSFAYNAAGHAFTYKFDAQVHGGKGPYKVQWTNGTEITTDTTLTVQFTAPPLGTPPQRTIELRATDHAGHSSTIDITIPSGLHQAAQVAVRELQPVVPDAQNRCTFSLAALLTVPGAAPYTVSYVPMDNNPPAGQRSDQQDVPLAEPSPDPNSYAYTWTGTDVSAKHGGPVPLSLKNRTVSFAADYGDSVQLILSAASPADPFHPPATATWKGGCGVTPVP